MDQSADLQSFGRATRNHRHTLLASASLLSTIVSLPDKVRQAHVKPPGRLVLVQGLGLGLIPFAQLVRHTGDDVTACNDEAPDDEDENDVEEVEGGIVAALGDLRVAHPGVVADRGCDESVVLRVFIAGYVLP